MEELLKNFTILTDLKILSLRSQRLKDIYGAIKDISYPIVKMQTQFLSLVSCRVNNLP